MTTTAIRAAALGGLCALLLSSVAGSADTPLKIGVVWTYSNPDPTIAGFDAGMETYVKMHGSTVAGRSVQIDKRDDGGVINPEGAKRVTQELIVQDNVDAIAGFVSTANVLAAAPVTLAAQKPGLIALAPSRGYMEKFPNLTRYSFTLYQLGAALGTYAARHGMKTAFTTYANVQAGIDASTGFSDAFAAGGGKVVGTDAIPTGTVEFTAYLQRIKDAKPDATFLFLPAFGGAQAFLQSYHNIGLDKLGVKLLTTGDLVDENNLKAIGDSAAGLISAYIYSQAHPSKLNAQFVRTFRTIAPSIEPNFVAVEGYDIMAAVYAAAAAGKGSLEYPKVMDTLRGLKWESPRGPVEIDPQTRDLIQNVYIRRTEQVNGKLQNTEIETIPMVHGPA